MFSIEKYLHFSVCFFESAFLSLVFLAFFLVFIIIIITSYYVCVALETLDFFFIPSKYILL